MPRASGKKQLAARLGERVRALRLEAGLTQEKLAWESEIQKPYLSQIEAGKRLPSLVVLSALARRLDVEVADLVALDRDEPRLALLEATRRREWQRAKALLRQLHDESNDS